MITLNEIKNAHEKVAEMIAQFEMQEKPAAAFPMTIEFPHLNSGERYIGTIVDAAGKAEHVILLPGDAEDLTWQEALEWAASIGGDLPNRIEQAMLFANHKDEFKPTWYWSNTRHEGNPDYAWLQDVSDGGQGCSHKSSHTRARAVRRVSALVL